MRAVAPCRPAAAALQCMGDPAYVSVVRQSDELGIDHCEATAHDTSRHNLDALPTELASQDRWRIGANDNVFIVRTSKEHLAESVPTYTAWNCYGVDKNFPALSGGLRQNASLSVGMRHVRRVPKLKCPPLSLASHHTKISRRRPQGACPIAWCS